MHRKLLIGALAIIALTATPALAAKGGKSHSETTGASSIFMNESTAYLGGTVTFTTNAIDLGGWEWPMVYVGCYQGGDLVYGSLDNADAHFLLGGGWSVWLQNGGDADCTATLYAYGWKGQTESVRELASTPSFHASGSAP